MGRGNNVLYNPPRIQSRREVYHMQLGEKRQFEEDTDDVFFSPEGNILISLSEERLATKLSEGGLALSVEVPLDKIKAWSIGSEGFAWARREWGETALYLKERRDIEGDSLILPLHGLKGDVKSMHVTRRDIFFIWQSGGGAMHLGARPRSGSVHSDIYPYKNKTNMSIFRRGEKSIVICREGNSTSVGTIGGDGPGDLYNLEHSGVHITPAKEMDTYFAISQKGDSLHFLDLSAGKDSKIGDINDQVLSLRSWGDKALLLQPNVLKLFGKSGLYCGVNLEEEYDRVEMRGDSALLWKKGGKVCCEVTLP